VKEGLTAEAFRELTGIACKGIQGLDLAAMPVSDPEQQNHS